MKSYIYFQLLMEGFIGKFSSEGQSSFCPTQNEFMLKAHKIPMQIYLFEV